MRHDTILIGYDGSDDAEAAIRCAGELLAPRRAVVANVWDSLSELLLPTNLDHLYGPMKEAADELDSQDAGRAAGLARQGAELAEAAGFEAMPTSARGRPKAWPTLLELADQHGAAAVVVGSRGLGFVGSALLGSVSAGVLGHARVPALIVPALKGSVAPGPVLVGYDGSDHSDAAVAAAGRLLKPRECVVETAWNSYAEVAPAGVAGAPLGVMSKAALEIDRAARESAQRTAEAGAQLAAGHGLTASAEAVAAHGSPWRALLDSAYARRAAALVVGSRGNSAFESALVGSVSRALVHHAPAPVLVVRPT
jgi:nucleotide-binding universal stress UspA family protein